jgi:hypothetical protein
MDEVSAHCRIFRVSADCFAQGRAALATVKFSSEQRSENWPLSRSLQTATFSIGKRTPVPRLSRQYPIRRNAVERPRSLRSGSCSEVERSEIWRVRPCAGQTVPMLGGASRTGDAMKVSARCGRVSFRPPTFCRSRGASAPRCPVEERSDEVLVPALARVGHETAKTGELEWHHPSQRRRQYRARGQASHAECDARANL